jgi:membrane protein
MLGLPLGRLLKTAAKEWQQQGALRIGAALSYYAVFSIAPLLIIVTFFVGFVHRGDTLEQVRVQFADFVSPEAADVIAKGVVSAGTRPERGIVHTVLATVLLVLGTSAFTHELRTSIDAIWNLKPKRGRRLHRALLQRLWTLLFVIGAGLFLQISVLLNSRASFYRQYVNAFLPSIEPIWRWVDTGVSFLVVLIIYGLSYKVLPSIRVAWRDVAGGAVVATLLFSLGKWVVALYLLPMSFTSVYGVAGSLTVLLVWLYYCSLIFLFGAKFTQIWAGHFGRPIAD